MAADPFRRFLGVDAAADPFTLLGLRSPTRDRVRIETALHDQLARVFRHPDGRSAEAERVRARLRAVAASLLNPSRVARKAVRPAPTRAPAARRTPPARPRMELTDFDRYVLAILVGCGGWNARCRAQLIALAASYGVTPAGLAKIVAGLNDYASAGGPRPAVAEITSAAGRLAAGTSGLPAAVGSIKVPAPSALRQRLGSIAVVPEPGPESTVKLSLLFGLLTVLAAVLFVRVMFSGSSETPPEEPSTIVAPTVPAGPRPATPEPTPEPGVARLARWTSKPTFVGNALPIEASDAADECSQLAAGFDLLTRKLSIADEPSEAVFVQWSASVEIVSRGWVLLDESTLRAIDLAVRDVLRETADTPSVGDRLLEALLPPQGRLREPLDIWRGAWRAGTLGAITEGGALPPSLVERARRQLVVALDERAEDTVSFDSAARAWLEVARDGLVETLELEERVYDFWEMWLAAVRKIDDAEDRQGMIMGAVTRLLETPTDLARPGPSVNVLGRLLATADFSTSRVVHDAIRGLFDRAEAEVADHDLWVLTSLLAQSDRVAWLSAELVLPDDAGPPFRRRIRDRIAADWPPLADPADAALARGRELQVDPRIATRWHRLLAASWSSDTGDSATLMRRLLLVARVNEAAVLIAARRRGEAEALLDDLERDHPSASGDGSPGDRAAPPLTPRARPGQSIGADGAWASAYAEVRRNTEEKLAQLQLLRSQAASDLGPLDAEVFVREVYRGSPQDVRALARSILAEQFADGPNVAMEMLDQFPEAPRSSERVADAIRRISGRVLPPARSESWSRAARLALAEHALSLRRTGASVIDDLALGLREIYANRAAVLDGEPLLRATLRTPEDAAGQLAAAWLERARMTIARVTVPGDLPDLARRRATRGRLTADALQRLVAELVTALEHAAYVTVAEQPRLRDAVVAELAACARQRRDARHVLSQAIETERALARIWALRMGLAVPDGTEPEVAP